MKSKKPIYTTILASTLTLFALSGCGGDDSSVESEIKTTEQKAGQDFEQTKAALNKEVKEAAEGVQSLTEDTKKQAEKVQQKATDAVASAQDAVKSVQSAPETAKKQAVAGMNQLQKTLTDQLGAQAATELGDSLSALKQQATNALVASQVDSLSKSLGSGDVDTSLSSLSSLAGLASTGDVNLSTLKDVVSVSSASILSDSFSGGETPSLIDSAISSLKDTKLFDGAKDMVKSLSSGDSMTAGQTDVVNQLIDSSLPMLGSLGEQLQQLRQGQKAASEAKGAVDAIQGMF